MFCPRQLFTFFEQISVILAAVNQEAIIYIMRISYETPMAVYGSGQRVLGQ